MATHSPQRKKHLQAAKAARDSYDAAFVNWLASMVKHKETNEIRKASRLLSVRGGELSKACEVAGLQVNLKERHDLKIKTLTPAQRLCLSVYIKGGLTGRARQLWIDEGLTLQEQIQRDIANGRVPPTSQVKMPANDNVKTYSAAQVAKRLGQSTLTVMSYARDNDVPSGRMTLTQAKRIAQAIKRDMA